jgi:secreted Zn-dependent insulinase-like peptidase
LSLSRYNIYVTINAGKTVFEVATSSEIFGVALEMLADMIGFPTLRNDLVIKEVEAVDSEFSLRQDDMPKYFQLLGSLAKEGHPLRKMDVGNRETLRVPNFHKKLVEWRDSHYCANYITLALEAPMSLIDLERLALKHFSNIPPCPLPAPKDRVQWQECPFENEVFHRIYHVPSVYHSEFMAIQWAIDAAAWKNFSVKPLEYLASLISHKGEGGLYHFLNHFGWASNVIGGCWVSDVCCNQYTSLFSIYIDMTEDGFRKQDYLLEAVFGYIEMLIRTGPSHSFFQECQKQQADYFHQRAVGYNSTYAESASVWLQHLPAQHVLAASALTSIYDPNLIETCTKMLEIEKCNVMIFSQKYLKREKLDMMEKFYKTPYASYEFPKGLVEKVRRLESHLAQLFYMPAPNRLLREITCCGNQQKNMIRSGPLMVIKGKCSLYYKEKKFRSIRGPFPQAKYVFWLQSPVTVDVQGSHAKMNLFSNFLNMMIESKFVAALAAHHNIEATVKHNRLQISITGPTHQLPQLAKDFFKVITVFEKLLDPTTFKVGKSRYVEDLDNVSLDNTWLAWDIVSFLFSSHHQLSTDRKSEVEGRTILQA